MVVLMTYLGDWKDAERHANPERFDAEMARVAWHHRMSLIRLNTWEVAQALEEAAERLEEIFA